MLRCPAPNCAPECVDRLSRLPGSCCSVSWISLDGHGPHPRDWPRLSPFLRRVTCLSLLTLCSYARLWGVFTLTNGRSGRRNSTCRLRPQMCSSVPRDPAACQGSSGLRGADTQGTGVRGGRMARTDRHASTDGPEHAVWRLSSPWFPPGLPRRSLNCGAMSSTPPDLDLNPARRIVFAQQVQSALGAQCPGSVAALRGSLARGTADMYSDIDLAWTVPDAEFDACVAAVGDCLGAVRVVASLRSDPAFHQSPDRRLMFVAFRDMPLFWRLDLEVTTASTEQIGQVGQIGQARQTCRTGASVLPVSGPVSGPTPAPLESWGGRQPQDSVSPRTAETPGGLSRPARSPMRWLSSRRCCVGSRMWQRDCWSAACSAWVRAGWRAAGGGRMSYGSLTHPPSTSLRSAPRPADQTTCG